MFTEPTVFITGAGASWHYGYPTGPILIEKTNALAKEINRYALKAVETNDNFLPQFMPASPTYVYSGAENWQKLAQKCDSFIQKIETSDPLVIDYFLGQNPSLEDIGKFLIAGVITNAHISFSKANKNPNRIEIDRTTKKEDNWIKFVVSKLFSKCDEKEDVLENKVDFITFNYDLSLEEHIYKAFKYTDLFDDDELINKFFSDRFHHIYGTVNWDYRQEVNLFKKNYETAPYKKYLEERDRLDFYFQCAQGLKVIAPAHKLQQCQQTEIAIEKIKNAKNIYILGYGFDENNNEKLLLDTLLKSADKRIFFTNYDDANVINKRAGNLLRDNIVSFMPYERPIYGNYNSPPYHEKSTRSVFGALEKDFPL